MPAQQPDPARPDSAPPPEDAVPTAPETDETAKTETAQTETAETDETETDGTETDGTDEAETPAAGPTRRERRARPGGAAGRVDGSPAGRRTPVPAKHRDYASRRRG